MIRRMQVRYEGRVQGVGFRAAVLRCAAGLGVVGFVRNESDGSVSLEAEGEADALERLWRRVGASEVGRYITARYRTWPAPTGQEQTFAVRY